MSHNNASAIIHAIGGEETIFVMKGLAIGTQYIAKCAQSDVLSTQLDFTTAEFLIQPVISTVSSTDVTFKMTPSTSGEISCIVLPNNHAVPNASVVMSKNNGIGVYQNVISAGGGSEVTFTVFNLRPGMYYDAYCAYIDIVSQKN